MERKANNERGVPCESLETVARNFFRESSEYGFSETDYIRFVNLLLDLSMRNNSSLKESSRNRGERVTAAANGLSELEPSGLPLVNENIALRPFEPEDVPILKRWLDDRHGRHFLISCTVSKTTTCEELVNSDSNILGTVTLLDGTPIGTMAFLDYDPVQEKAELRKLIGDPEMRGKGLAKEATRLWIRYGLTTLKLKKIYLSTLNTHIRNIRLNEDLGFQVEGILRSEVFFDGKRHDVLRMGLSRE